MRKKVVAHSELHSKLHIWIKKLKVYVKNVNKCIHVFKIVTNQGWGKQKNIDQANYHNANITSYNNKKKQTLL